MDSAGDLPEGRGFPIRTSADQRSLASPRGFSQRATSFIASQRQGIHRTPLSCSRSQPPPPARRTEPRSKGTRAPHERQRKPHHPARTHTLTLKTTQPIPDSPVKEQKPRPRFTRARPVFWKRSRTGAYGRSHAPRPGHPDARRHRTPAARALRHVRHEQDVGASRVENGAQSRTSVIVRTDRNRVHPHPRRGSILERR